jgi:hypothetical protein
MYFGNNIGIYIFNDDGTAIFNDHLSFLDTGNMMLAMFAERYIDWTFPGARHDRNSSATYAVRGNIFGLPRLRQAAAPLRKVIKLEVQPYW